MAERTAKYSARRYFIPFFLGLPLAAAAVSVRGAELLPLGAWFSGYERMRLAKSLSAASCSSRGTDVAADVERQLHTTVIGTQDTCLLRLQSESGTTEPFAPWSTSSSVYDAARRCVLDLTVRLKQAIGTVPRSVRFGELELVRDGLPRCVLLMADWAADLVTAAVPELKIAGDRDQANENTAQLLAGSLGDSPQLREVVEHALMGEVTPHCPRPGHYLLRILPASTTLPQRLVIVGGDREGAEIGVRNFLRLLATSNDW